MVFRALQSIRQNSCFQGICNLDDERSLVFGHHVYLLGRRLAYVPYSIRRCSRNIRKRQKGPRKYRVTMVNMHSENFEY